MSYNSGYQGNFDPARSATIALGATESDVITCGGFALCQIITPAAFTGVAFTFLACSTSGGTFVPLYNAAGPVSYTAAAARAIAIDPKDFQGVAFLKIVSGTAEGAARTLICSLKGF